MPGKKAQSFPMTKSVPALLARTQFGQILTRVAQHHERFVVTNNGQATAVIVSIEDYLRSVANTPASMAALQEQAKRSGADKLTLEEIQAEIEAVRQAKTSHRSVSP